MAHYNREAQLYDEAAGLLTRLLRLREPVFPGDDNRVERLIQKARRRHDRRFAALEATPEWMVNKVQSQTLFREEGR